MCLIGAKNCIQDFAYLGIRNNEMELSHKFNPKSCNTFNWNFLSNYDIQNCNVLANYLLQVLARGNSICLWFAQGFQPHRRRSAGSTCHPVEQATMSVNITLNLM